VKFIFFGLLIFNLGQQVWNFSNPKNKPSFIVENEKEIKNANAVYQTGKVEQDVILYLYFLNDKIEFRMPENLGKSERWIRRKNGEYILGK